VTGPPCIGLATSHALLLVRQSSAQLLRAGALLVSSSGPSIQDRLRKPKEQRAACSALAAAQACFAQPLAVQHHRGVLQELVRALAAGTRDRRGARFDDGGRFDRDRAFGAAARREHEEPLAIALELCA
jgi:hypothetical protein